MMLDLKNLHGNVYMRAYPVLLDCMPCYRRFGLLYAHLLLFGD